MRTNVTFRHPAEFLSNQDDAACVLAVRGAHWFLEIMTRVPRLELDRSLCQEDWGVVLFARRNQQKFWIGLSAWDTDGVWLAHFHHGSFAWLQWFSSRGNAELKCLLTDFHDVLEREPAITDIAWHAENDMNNPEPIDFPRPV